MKVKIWRTQGMVGAENRNPSVQNRKYFTWRFFPQDFNNKRKNFEYTTWNRFQLYFVIVVIVQIIYSVVRITITIKIIITTITCKKLVIRIVQNVSDGPCVAFAYVVRYRMSARGPVCRSLAPGARAAARPRSAPVGRPVSAPAPIRLRPLSTGPPL